MWKYAFSQGQSFSKSLTAPDLKFKKYNAKADTIDLDATARLVCRGNEATIILEGKEFTALLHSDAQVSDISCQLCLDLGLEIKSLGNIILKFHFHFKVVVSN